MSARSGVHLRLKTTTRAIAACSGWKPASLPTKRKSSSQRKFHPGQRISTDFLTVMSASHRGAGIWTPEGISACTFPIEAGNILYRTQLRKIHDAGSMTSGEMPVSDPKPPAYKAVRVWIADGSRMLGMWTGTKWWSTKGEIKPVKWELEERKKKKTEKLLKAIARDEELS